MENKKRKGKDVEEVEEEEEEMKMDKFYALLRQFRDARDRRRKEIEDLENAEKKKKKKKKLGTEQQHHVWVPSFQWEDFTNDVEFIRARGQPLRLPTASASTSPNSPRATDKQRMNNVVDDQHQRDHSLDLNLAL